MSIIYKYPLKYGKNEISTTKGAQLLTVQMQHGTPCLWAFIDPTKPPIQIVLNIYGTGHNMPDDPGKYVGTFHLGDQGLGTALVWHLFETGRYDSLAKTTAERRRKRGKQ